MTPFNRVIEVSIERDGAPRFNTAELRVVFDVEKTTQVTSNTALINIYNMSANSRNQIRELDDNVILRAGYTENGGPKVIFTGSVLRIAHNSSYQDSITRIDAGDGTKNLREKRASSSFNAGTPASTILQDIARKMGLALRPLPGRISGEYVNGFSHSGSVRDALVKITDRLKLEWSIQNNELQILEKRGVTPGVAVELSYSNGLVGVPERLNDLQNYLIGDKPKPGYRLTTLLRPEVEPGGQLILKTKDVSGTFRIELVKHVGDNFGSDFLTILEVTEV